MNPGRKVPLSLTVNTSGGKGSSSCKIATCHQCGTQLHHWKTKQAKWLQRAWEGELGCSVKSHIFVFFFVSAMKSNRWTSCDLVSLVLLWAVIIYICKNSFRVQETELLKGTYFQQCARIRLSPLQLSLSRYPSLDTFLVSCLWRILDIISGELDKVVVVSISIF